MLLVTGREVKAAGTPSDPGRLALVESLDEVERVWQPLTDPGTGSRGRSDGGGQISLR